MNAVHAAQKDGLLRRFLGRMAEPGLRVLENPTDELVHELARGRKPRLHGMGGPGVQGRIELNYLYYTRRFPLNTTNNTIGAGALAAQDYLYFTNGLGDQGSAAGYFSIANLTLQQTNMASGGKVPNGRGYRMHELGITFNAAAATGDVAQCLDVMNLRFEKQSAQLVLQHGPIKFWPGGTGLYGYATTTVAGTTIQGASNGAPSMANVRRSRLMRVLDANDQFSYVINAAAATPNANTTVALTNFVEVTIWLWGEVIDKIAA